MRTFEQKDIIITDLDSYKDDRGELYSCFKSTALKNPFVEDRISRSTRGVIRGMHGDAVTGKLCICLEGAINLVAWNIEKQEKTQLYLTHHILQSIYIPENFLLGHQCISNYCILLYKWTHYYQGPDKQWTIRYDDPSIGANWLKIDPILSERDKNAKYFNEVFR